MFNISFRKVFNTLLIKVISLYKNISFILMKIQTKLVSAENSFGEYNKASNIFAWDFNKEVLKS